MRDQAAPDDAPRAYVAKYAALLAKNGWTIESFLRDYPVEIRIRPTRVRGG